MEENGWNKQTNKRVATLDTCFKVFHNEQNGYHCQKTGFDMCKQCFQGCSFPNLNHPLTPAKPSIKYRKDGGGLQCDGCKKEEQNWFCMALCRVSIWCLSKVSKARQVFSSSCSLQCTHPSVIGLQGQWKCDHCELWKESTNCCITVSSVGFIHALHAAVKLQNQAYQIQFIYHIHLHLINFQHLFTYHL